MVAYADTEAGEIGTIYQASGWYYLGPGSTVIEWVSPSGRVYNKRVLAPTSRTTRDGKVVVSRGWAPTAGPDRTRRGTEALLAAGWRQQRSNPKLRYGIAVDKRDAETSSRLRAMALPYPKRASAPATPSGEGELDDAPDVQSGEDASKRSRRSK